MLTLIWKMQKTRLPDGKSAGVCAQKDINFYDISCWEWIREETVDGPGWKGKNSYLIPAAKFTTGIALY